MGKYHKSTDGDDPTVIYVSRKVGLHGHCNNDGMKEALSNVSLFASQSRQLGGIRALYLINTFLSDYASSIIKDELGKIFKKNSITSQGFWYKCSNKHSQNEKEKMYDHIYEDIDDCYIRNLLMIDPTL